MTTIPHRSGATAPAGDELAADHQRGFTLLELMIAVAIIGILAAVAVPAFMKYIRKARTTEALQETEKIYNGARVYFFEAHGSAVQPQFPDSQAATPAASCCANGGKCAPDPADWETPTWTALSFSMNDPFYYQYQFISTGVGNSSHFTAMAQGNLDCDADYSTFTMEGKVDPKDGAFGLAAIGRKDPLE